MTTESSSMLVTPPPARLSSRRIYRAKLARAFHDVEPAVLVSFWLFGLINNVLYVIILSAALDLVGPDIPKGVVLLADVLPSFLTKLVAPYFIHRVAYAVRIVIFVVLSGGGMLMLALSPSAAPGDSVGWKLLGIVLSSLSSGAGELSFLGLTHYYGQLSLAAWGSGTGGAGLAGAGLYVLLTSWLGFSVKHTLLASAFLPLIMLLSFFCVLPKDQLADAAPSQRYQNLPASDETDANMHEDDAEDLSDPETPSMQPKTSLKSNLQRAKNLFLPYMLPLLLVYISEYTINQGVAPTLLFPLSATPFTSFRDFYPFYSLLYQIGVFVARSSTPFVRIRNLYVPSLLQVVNLVLLISHALFAWIPSVWLVFLVILWEGLLGGAVYVNTFAAILEEIPPAQREFSLGATSVSDSGGVCVAGVISMSLELALCQWQVDRGRPWCRQL